MRRGRAWTGCALLAGAMWLVGCAGNEPVVRVVDGHVLEGRFIGVEAYGSFLHGALLEEQGDFPGALEAYEGTQAVDPGDPEVARRIARMRWRIDPRGTAPEEALPVGDVMPARGSELPDSARRRIEAVTLLHGDHIEAWEALVAWGNAHGDVPLAVRGMLGLVKCAPGQRTALAKAAIALAGRGYLAEARQVAGALLDADPTDGGAGAALAAIPLLARLGLDESLVRGDVGRTAERSARAHLGLEVAAGRAWIAGDGKVARELLASTVKADPSNLAARVVAEGASGRAASHLLPASLDSTSMLAPEVVLPFARDVLQAEGNVAARRVMLAMGKEALPSGDARLTPLAVALAIAGVVTEEALPVDARIELAARRFVAPDAADAGSSALDERHALLAAALLRPTDPLTHERAARLAGVAPQDPLVAVALAKIALARSEAVSPELRAVLDALAPADPMVAAVVVGLAQHGGAPAAVAHARKSLAALAKTPGERALAAE